MQGHAAAYDYIVVGAGTAGCVLANRLSADPQVRVLLLEAGPPDRSWLLHMPAGLRSVFKPSNRYNWWYETTAQTHLDDRRIAQPRGKTLGGSSSINGMTFLRGQPADYDAWAAHGCAGWSWRDVLPYFRRVERAAHGDPAWRGRSGPVGVQRMERLGALNRAFLEAGRELGLPDCADANGPQPDGVGRFDMSVHGGVRASAARAYLHPVADRPNLSVRTGVRVERVALERGRAVGVVVRRNGRSETLRAEREVLLAAGAFGSPQLLMLSGIGPPAHLRATGLAVAQALPGVGENLQDHLEAHVQVRSDRPVSLNRELRPHRMALAGLSWLLLKRGPAASALCHVGAFLRSRPEVARPDLQMHFFPVFFDAGWLPRAGGYGYRLGVGPVRPESRGRLRLTSADPDAAPAIDPNYLAAETDRRQIRDGVRHARALLGQPAFRPFHAAETQPGADVRSDAEIDAFVRAQAASAYHPCGTCRMGPDDDPGAVVDPQLRVRGVAGLRVVDAAVMPTLPSANINAPTFMLAEKAADLIRAVGPDAEEPTAAPCS